MFKVVFNYVANKISKEFSKTNIKKNFNKILSKNGREIYLIFFQTYNEKKNNTKICKTIQKSSTKYFFKDRG